MSSTAAAAELPEVTNTNWVLYCETVAQKQELMDYAVSAGVWAHETQPAIFLRNRNDGLLGLGYANALVSYEPEPRKNNPYQEVTADQFKAMCDAYANR